MVEELSCASCDKVYVRKGALQSHIKNKHQGDRRQPDQEDQGQLFHNIDIPDDMDEFPGPSDETMREAGEAADDMLAGDADAEVEQQLNLNCDNCANSTSIEKRLTLKVRALEKTKCCLQKKNKDQKNELDNCRKLLATTVKENVVNKGIIETKEAQKQIKRAEIITLTDEEEGALKSCEYCEFNSKGEVSLQRHQRSVQFRCHACDMVAVSMKHLNVHKKNAHKEANCDPCRISFRDEMRCNAHILKEHPFQCKECGDKYT